jgi:hypothetical protein
MQGMQLLIVDCRFLIENLTMPQLFNQKSTIKKSAIDNSLSSPAARG